MLLVETSSQETYGGTIQFYERTGYALAGRIEDYYRLGDDKLIFAKKLGVSIPADAATPARAEAETTKPRELTETARLS